MILLTIMLRFKKRSHIVNSTIKNSLKTSNYLFLKCKKALHVINFCHNNYQINNKPIVFDV